MKKHKIGGLETWFYKALTCTDTDEVPIVLVPGASARGLMCHNMAATLAQHGRTVYAVSLPGHGESDLYRGKPLGKHTIQDFGAALGEFLEVLGTRADVWAHSLGGAVAQTQFGSGRIRNAVLISSTVPRIPLVGRPAVALRASKYWKEMLFGRPFHYGRDDYLSLLMNRTDSAEADEIYAGVVPESGRAISQVCMGLTQSPKRVLIEWLVVVSSTDDLVTPAYMAGLLSWKYNRHCPVARVTIRGDHMKVFTRAGAEDVVMLKQLFD